MTITNQELIADALGLIGVLAEGKVPTANQASQALRKLNGLVKQWESDGIDLQYVDQDISQLSHDCPITPESELAVTYYLSFSLAPHYGKQVSPEEVTIAQALFNSLLRNSVSSKVRELDMTNLPFGTGQCRNGDILTG